MTLAACLACSSCKAPPKDGEEPASPSEQPPESGARTPDESDDEADGDSAAAGGTTSGAPGVETCFDGKDDDGDGDVDCADKDCVPVARCVPVAEDESIGVTVDASSACPPGTSDGPILHGDLDAGGGCLGCGCSGSWSCAESVTMYTGPACTVSSYTMAVSAGDCTATSYYYDGGFVLNAQVVGGCSANGSATLMPASWKTSVKFCVFEDLGGGCGSGSVCAPEPGGTCSLGAGTRSCSEPLQDAKVLYTGFDDGRSCGACACDAAPPVSDCSFGVYFNADCNGANPDLVVPPGNYCSLPSWPAGFVSLSPPEACTASSAPLGGVSLEGEHTLCCN